MADFSNTRINMALFQKTGRGAQFRQSTPCHRLRWKSAWQTSTSSFPSHWPLEPVDNWKGEPCIKLRCAVWHRETKNGKPWESISVTPDRAAEYKEEDLATPHTKAAQPVAAAGRGRRRGTLMYNPPQASMPLW